jgi:methyltransferase-like protein
MLDVSPKPTASPVARWQVKTGPKVTNLRHERVTLQGITYHLLPCLDGSQDRTALLNTLQALVEKGIVKIEPNGQTTQQTGQTRLDLADVLEQELQRLARAALLVG